jgi:flavin reductase (DIM6/NTAB) family NADH-FMN oxidoreductase RutF
MVMCSTDFDSDVDEFEISGLNPVPSNKISPPRLLESKISYECELNQIVEIGEGDAGSGFIVIGTIVLFHIDDDVYDNGHILLDRLEPLGRLAGNQYTRPNNNLEIIRKVKPK